MHPYILTAAALLVALPTFAQMGAGNQARDSFSNFDDDRDGAISRDEAAVAGFLESFDQIDQDLDGGIEEPEFNAMDPADRGPDPLGAASAENEGEQRAEYWMNR